MIDALVQLYPSLPGSECATPSVCHKLVAQIGELQARPPRGGIDGSALKSESVGHAGTAFPLEVPPGERDGESISAFDSSPSTGYVVAFPAALKPNLAQVFDACRAGQTEKAIQHLNGIFAKMLGEIPRPLGPSCPATGLVQGLSLTREFSPRLQLRLEDLLSLQLAQALAQQLDLPYIDRDKVRLGLPPSQPNWVMACSVQDEPSTFVLLAKAWSPRFCEFWGEDCALYTADPTQLPGARVIRQLDFRSAMELARLKNLRPSAETLEGLFDGQLKSSVTLRSFALDFGGQSQGSSDFATQVVSEADSAGRAHTLVSQNDITLLSVESSHMWGGVGFLQRLFTALADLRFSVDLLATSQTHVSVTLDSNSPAFTSEHRQYLEKQLGAQVQIYSNCAAVTLVGRRLRTLWNQLGHALEVFDDQRIHMINHASSDVALTFVLEEEQSERLVRSLHQHLFGEDSVHLHLGPTWQQLHGGPGATTDAKPGLSLLHRWESQEWWIQKRDLLLELSLQKTTPLYVYDGATIAERADQLQNLKGIKRLFYAMKANSNPEILKLLWSKGLGLECVSPGELERVQQIVDPQELRQDRLLYTPNFAPKSDYQFGLSQTCWTTLDSLAPLQQWPEVFANRSVFLRLDPGKGAGHHRHVNTGGKMSKFGISLDQLQTLLPLLHQHSVKVVGLHCHAGSGILDPSNWFKNGCILAEMAQAHFPEVQVLDLGGGLGVSDRPGRPRLDLVELHRYLEGLQKLYPNYQYWLEPGRFLVAESGVLLAQVTQIKQKGDRYYVGTNAGMHSLIRPALYGAYHHIINLTRWHEQPTWKVDVVGPICETGDFLGRDRWLPECRPGDTLLIATAGAYGKVMSSQYNLRGTPDEVMLPVGS